MSGLPNNVNAHCTLFFFFLRTSPDNIMYTLMLGNTVTNKQRSAALDLWLFCISIIACCQSVTHHHCHAADKRAMSLLNEKYNLKIKVF